MPPMDLDDDKSLPLARTYTAENCMDRSAFLLFIRFTKREIISSMKRGPSFRYSPLVGLP